MNRTLLVLICLFSLLAGAFWIISASVKLPSFLSRVPGNPLADRPVAGTARASMRGAGSDMINDDGRGVSRCSKSRAFQRPARSKGWFRRLLARDAGFALAEDAPEGDPWPHNCWASGECRVTSIPPVSPGTVLRWNTKKHKRTGGSHDGKNQTSCNRSDGIPVH